MTVARCARYTKYLSNAALHRYAAEGLNVAINGMSPEDAEIFLAVLRSRAKRRQRPVGARYAITKGVLVLPTRRDVPRVSPKRRRYVIDNSADTPRRQRAIDKLHRTHPLTAPLW